MSRTHLENAILAAIPVLAVCRAYDMSLHSLLALVLMHENSTQKYYIGSGMILMTTYNYFATHEQFKILFSILLSFTLLGCAFQGDVKQISQSYSAVECCEVPEEEVPQKNDCANCDSEQCFDCECGKGPSTAPVEESLPADAPAPVEAAPSMETRPPASPPSDHTEKKRPRIVAKLHEPLDI